MATTYSLNDYAGYLNPPFSGMIDRDSNEPVRSPYLQVRNADGQVIYLPGSVAEGQSITDRTTQPWESSFTPYFTDLWMDPGIKGAQEQYQALMDAGAFYNEALPIGQRQYYLPNSSSALRDIPQLTGTSTDGGILKSGVLTPFMLAIGAGMLGPGGFGLTGTNAGGLAALNSFDTGAMASAMGSSPSLLSALGTNIASQFTPENLLQRAGTNALGQFATTGEVDLRRLATGVGVGGVSGGVGNTVTNSLNSAGFGTDFSNRALGSGVGGVTGAFLRGGDPLTAFAGGIGSNLINEGLGSAINTTGARDFLGNGLTNAITGAGSSYLNNLIFSNSGTNSFDQGQPYMPSSGGTDLSGIFSGIQSGFNWEDFLNFSSGTNQTADPYFADAESYDPNGAQKPPKLIQDNQFAPNQDQIGMGNQQQGTQFVAT